MNNPIPTWNRRLSHSYPDGMRRRRQLNVIIARILTYLGPSPALSTLRNCVLDVLVKLGWYVDSVDFMTLFFDPLFHERGDVLQKAVLLRFGHFGEEHVLLINPNLPIAKPLYRTNALTHR